jgi:hypothetical protein
MPPACREVVRSGHVLLAAVLDRPREPLDGRTHRKQSVHLRRVDVVMVKLAMRSVLGETRRYPW